MGAILYKGKVYGAGGSIIEGYYKVADGKFYEEDTYTTEILGAEDLLYIDLTSKMQFIFDGTNFVNITEDAKPTVTEAGTRTNIASGDTLKTIIGKIKKFFSDLKTVAFTGAYSDLSGTPTIPTITDTYSGTSSDGMSGKAVKEGLDTLITETDTTNTKPYLYRASQTTGDRLYDKLVGCSFAVNQLVQNGNFSDTSGWTANSSKVSGFSVSSNVASMSISSGNGGYDGILYTANYIPYVQGHKYLVMADFKSTLANTICTVYAGTNAYNILSNSVSRITLSTANTWYKLTKIVTASNSSDGTTNSRTRVGIISTSFSSAITLNVKNVIVIDLTQMFGTAIANEAYAKEQASAGSGIAWLKSYGFFTKDYYPYNAGSLVSVKPTAHKMVGKNLVFQTITGASVDASGKVVSNSVIDLQVARVKQGETYTATEDRTPANVFACGFFTEIPVVGSYTYNGGRYTESSSTFTAPIDGYVAFWTNTGYATPMLEIGSTKTTYEPYTEYTYPLTTELRGIPTFVNGEIVYNGDINEGDGSTVRKYLHQNLGDLNWNYNSNTQMFDATIPNGKHINSVYGLPCSCSKYEAFTGNVSNLGNKQISVGSGFSTSVCKAVIKDSSYTDATTFKTAMSGVYLVAELATTTTEPSTPFTNPQICDKNGTEEYIDSRDMPIPVGHDTKYVDVPDWMEDGYYKDFRDRADSLFSPSVEVIATNVGSVPVYVTQSQLERYSMIAMVVFAKPFSAQSKIMAGTTYILTKSLVDGMAIQLDLSKSYNTSEITYYTGYFAIMLGSDLHHIDIYGIR